MHRLPQYHRGNPQVECHNIYQVNQNDTPLSPRVFIVGERSNFKKIPTHTQDHGDA